MKSIIAGLSCALLLSNLAMAAGKDPDVKDLAARWTSAYNKGAAAELGALYSPNAEVYIHREGRYIGRSIIQAYWAGDMKVGAPFTILNVTDSIADAEMILVHGNYQVVDRVSGVPQGSGRFAHIWVKSAQGQWQLDRDVWSQPYLADSAPDEGL